MGSPVAELVSAGVLIPGGPRFESCRTHDLLRFHKKRRLNGPARGRVCTSVHVQCIRVCQKKQHIREEFINYDYHALTYEEVWANLSRPCV